MDYKKEYDIIIIGGGPAGIMAGLTARKNYPQKSILLIRSIKTPVIPCAIPYMFKTMKNPEENIVKDTSLSANNIDVRIDLVESVDPENKQISLTNKNTKIKFDKLIMATGSIPVTPPIKGIEKKGIYVIKKDFDYLKEIYNEVKKAKNIVIIGGGFIGVEFADELSKIKGKSITIIEMLPRLLQNSFDEEFSELVREELNKKGVKILTNTIAEKFEGNEKIKSIKLNDNKRIDADLVILGMGTRPNSKLAEKAGLEVGKNGIAVDEYLRTSHKDIFAIGDCAEKKDFFTEQKINVMLASTACAEARIAASNLYNIKIIRENKGTISTYSTHVGNISLGSAGITEENAKKHGFKYITGKTEVPDMHPGTMPGASKIRLKLIFSETGTLIGGQASGGRSIGEIINQVGVAIQKHISANEIETMQIATHPKLTASPIAYPVISAAQDALVKLNK